MITLKKSVLILVLTIMTISSFQLDAMRRSHGDNDAIFRCTVEGCDAVFTDLASLNSHTDEHVKEFVSQNDDSLQEDDDRLYYENAVDLLNSFKPEHEGMASGKWVPRENLGKAPVQTRDKSKELTCDYEGCHYKTSRRSELNKHICMHADGKQFKCNVKSCGKLFSHECNLTRHMFTHAAEKPLKCDVKGCGKLFTRLDSLKAHSYTHAAEKPFKCNVQGCDYAAAINTNLTRHIKEKHLGQKREHKNVENKSKNIKK